MRISQIWFWPGLILAVLAVGFQFGYDSVLGCVHEVWQVGVMTRDMSMSQVRHGRVPTRVKVESEKHDN